MWGRTSTAGHEVGRRLLPVGHGTAILELLAVAAEAVGRLHGRVREVFVRDLHGRLFVGGRARLFVGQGLRGTYTTAETSDPGRGSA